MSFFDQGAQPLILTRVCRLNRSLVNGASEVIEHLPFPAMASADPRFSARLRFLERPLVREQRHTDRSLSSFPGLDLFADPPPFAKAETRTNSGGGHLPSYTVTVSAARVFSL